MADVIIDSYSESNQDSGWTLDTASTDEFGQTITGNGEKITKCKFYLSIGWGSPTGDVYCRIYAMQGTYGSTGKPTGSVLATSSTVDISSISSTWPTHELKEFTFTGANSITLTNGTRYCLMAVTDDCNYGNYLTVGLDESSPTHGGNACDSTSAYSSYDCCFYAYSTEAPAGTNMKINIADAWKDVSAIKINIADTWKPVTSVKVNIADSWKTVF